MANPTPGGDSIPVGLYIAIGCASAALIFLLLVVCICCCYCFKCCRKCWPKRKKAEGEETFTLLEEGPTRQREEGGKKDGAMRLKRDIELEKKRRKKEKKEKAQRDTERRGQEKQEVSVAKEVIEQFNQDREEQYIIQTPLPELGSRMQKHWFRGHYRDASQVIVTEAPLTKHCRLTLNRMTLDTINNTLLLSIREHPFIQPVQEIMYISTENKILTVQPLVARGSLRDYIFHEQDPLLDWSRKYASRVQGLPMDQMSLFGRQILEAAVFLHKQGFSSLGHIQCGNVLVVTDSCVRLGGYENTLLGYRTKLYRDCMEEGYLKNIDIIMFGHVMYEMGYGRDLEDLFPQEQDFMMVDKRGQIRDIVDFIFDKKSQTNFKPILKHKFFAERLLSEPIPQIETPKKVKQLLGDVSKGVARQPESPSSPGHGSRDARKQAAERKVGEFLESSPTYDSKALKPLPDIGHRIGKYWYKVKRNNKGEQPERTLLLSISALPDSGPIHLNAATQKTINDLFSHLSQHPYLHQTAELHYVKESHHIMLIQHSMEQGSLRDRILATKPFDNWTGKLQKSGTPLPDKVVSLYGRQILEAVCFLYEQGFPPLGHLHSGNIFVEVDRTGKGTCKVGGYENTLLGYKTCQRVFLHRRYSNSIDLQMFGHVVYEMASGRVLQQALPVEKDYSAITGDRKGIGQLLSFIFNKSSSVDSGAMPYKEALQEVKGHSFFITPAHVLEDSNMNLQRVPKDMKNLLDKVSKYKRK